jgi:hypothetical protein
MGEAGEWAMPPSRCPKPKILTALSGVVLPRIRTAKT